MDAKNIYIELIIRDVINLLDTMVKEGDKILVKGSRGMKMEEIVSHLDRYKFCQDSLQ